MAEQNPEQQNKLQEPESPENPRQKSRRRFVIILVVAIVVVGALLFWWHSTYYEDTDDAQINGHLIQISSRINGHVIKVNVEENQFVEAGTVLAEIDPKDFETAVQQDEANLEAAEANYEGARVNIPVIHTNTGSNLASANADVSSAQSGIAQAEQQLEAAQAQVAQAEANATKSQLDLDRYTPLVQRDIISKQQYDSAVAAALGNKAAVSQAQANLMAARANVRMMHDKLLQARSQYKYAQTGPQQVAMQKAKADQAAAQVEQARAALAQAKLNLSYTKIVAPVTGIVTTKSVEVGQNVSIGQNMMTLVSLDDVWITANFKETQLEHMRAGQAVTFTVDAYGGRKYDGKVTQIGGATGSVLSLFPPENATGNYVKVVQRIPVRIDLTNTNENSDHLLRPGMSVEPKVRVKR
ncbi:HlyD family secretion protein [Acidipila rosea]|uniref:Membrane fusion protein (Multidrug efflux system) n=1 Tax=Acidipila rosea TaxID=768535 RepID=A0A4V6NEU5_9BACT|nr:HlyD family secretion protein [Acidipila rosea]MBW4027202.1 HlyD family secretion protein [Acidobacteriota bacterium]MBW4045779.1 HlyD family secretion protein [Acidobacteriota bacterium]TCK74291.1 membrane fusion protein (multidrug efflux system) [Acidipila rosea]